MITENEIIEILKDDKNYILQRFAKAIIDKIKGKEKHILEVIGIIQNDCAIIDSDKDISVSELRIGFAHIQGLCRGLKMFIEYKKGNL